MGWASCRMMYYAYHNHVTPVRCVAVHEINLNNSCRLHLTGYRISYHSFQRRYIFREFYHAHGRCAYFSIGGGAGLGRHHRHHGLRGQAAHQIAQPRTKSAHDGRAGSVCVCRADDQLFHSRHRLKRAPGRRHAAGDFAGARGGVFGHRFGAGAAIAVFCRRWPARAARA